MLIGELFEGRPFRAVGSKPTPARASRGASSCACSRRPTLPRSPLRCRARASSHDSAPRIGFRDRGLRTPGLRSWPPALTGLTIAAPTLHLRFGGWVLIGSFALGGLGACGASRVADGADQRSALIVILAGAVAMRLALLFVEPYLSTDIYRYIWDGRVQAAGINPYRYVPSAPELAQLRDAAIFPIINRADYAVTIYPPAAQAIFLAMTRLGESVLAMKLGLLAFEAATVAALLALLRRLGAPATRIAAYAWHPLPIWEIAGNGHVDAAMCALLMAGLLLFLHGRTLLAGVAATLGALVKPTALLALPVFWRPWDWRLPLVVAAHRSRWPTCPTYRSAAACSASCRATSRRRACLGLRPRLQAAVADGAVDGAAAARQRASTSASPLSS